MKESFAFRYAPNYGSQQCGACFIVECDDYTGWRQIFSINLFAAPGSKSKFNWINESNQLPNVC